MAFENAMVECQINTIVDIIESYPFLASLETKKRFPVPSEISVDGYGLVQLAPSQIHYIHSSLPALKIQL